jgi:hypothetical protein
LNNREKQIILVKIEYNRKKILEEESKDTPDEAMIEKYKRNIVGYTKEIQQYEI